MDRISLKYTKLINVNNYSYCDNLFLNEIRKFEDKDLKQKKQLQILSCSNATIYPKSTLSQGGVTDQNGKYIKLSMVNALNEIDVFGGENNNDNIADKQDIDVIYLGNIRNHWGHFLIDCISRLWIFLKKDYRNCFFVYTGQKLKGIYLDFFKLYGFDEEKLIYIDKPTTFSNVIIPECSHMPGLYYTQEWIEIFDRVIVNALQIYEGQHSSKIIFSRRNFLKFGRAPFEIGENIIAKEFAKNNYEIVCPEEYTLVDQIGIINNSEEIVSVNGTLAHNLIFASPGTRLIQLKKFPEINYRQIEINQARNLNVFNIDINISPFVVRNGGPFVFDFNDNLIKYFDDHHLIYDKLLRFKQFFRRKIYFVYYMFVFVFFTLIVQRKEKKAKIIFMDENERNLLEKKMKKFYFIKFFK